jgi:hypothetical protein
MARKHRSRRIEIIQDSPFLKLPAEIREQIYYAALVRPAPIDLWPLKYTKDPSTTRVIRVQEDLLFVRKEMATGLVTTCKQIFYEASNIFWSNNTFRFSGDIEWTGARRFLGQIGPRALSQLQSLELFAPVADAHCLKTTLLDGNEYIKGENLYINAREAKNRPKMHMIKARQEPWARKWTWISATNFVLTRNVEHVGYLLEMAKASLELKLILPRGFGLSSVDRLGGGRHPEVIRELPLPEQLLGIAPFFTRGVTLVIEAGAQLRSLQTAEEVAFAGIDVSCQPGSLIDDDHLVGSRTEVLIARRWTNLNREWGFLFGISTLFDGTWEDSVPALGGRATSTSGPKNTARILRGFGGCRFIERDEWHCVGCPYQNSKYKWKTGRWTGGNYLHCPTNTKCSVNKVLVVKKKNRAARNGVINSDGV